MYESFYGLREKPFSLTPDPAFLYPTRSQLMALTLLEYGLANHAGFSLVTGEVGSGKTTLIRHWLNQLDKSAVVGLITNTNRSFGKLLQWVCVAFGLEHKGKDDAALYETFVEFLVSQYGRGRRVTLIVDEAQNLDLAMLEELRVLSNINADKHLVLQTFLVGQPELRETLKQPALRQFAQRISVDYHLPVLSLIEAYHYVRHRLQVAGGNADLIRGDAIHAAHAAAGGVPRLINQLCDTALVYAFAEQLPCVEAPLMNQVIADRQRGGLWTVAPANAPATAVAQESAPFATL
jgi:type II secretory pathway predicted ATPase ExeA